MNWDSSSKTELHPSLHSKIIFFKTVVQLPASSQLQPVIKKSHDGLSEHFPANRLMSFLHKLLMSFSTVENGIGELSHKLLNSYEHPVKYR